MNKRGVSLVEILGAVVIFGLVTALTALFFNLYSTAADKISRASRANAEGLLVVQTLEDYFRTIQATDYSLGSTANSIILEHHFTETYDPDLSEIVTIIHNPPLTLSIDLNPGELLINNTSYAFMYFSLDATSTLTITEDAGIVTVIVNLVLLTDNGELFPFTVSTTFTIQAIPA